MISVCHVISGDQWAGAEVQVAATIERLTRQPYVRTSAVLFNDGPLAKCLSQLNVPVLIADEKRTPAAAIVAELVRHFQQHHVDIVHTHRYNDTTLATVAAVLAGRPRVVRTVHGLREPMTGWSGLRFRAYEQLERLALRWRADAIIAVSHDIAARLAGDGYESDVIRQIHNCIDATTHASQPRHVMRRELGLPESAIAIGTAGRLTPVKGHSALLRIARLALQQRKDLVWVIAGDGPLRDQLRAQAARLGISAQCRFVGARADVHDVIAALDVFVLPSLHEGIPMALLEAMTLGVPVVAHSVGGVPEMIDHGITGVLVESGNEPSFADACLALASRPEERRRLAMHAQATVASRFSAQRSHDALLAVYRDVVARPRRDGTHPRLAAIMGALVLTTAAANRHLRHALAHSRAGMTRTRDNASARRALLTAHHVLILCHGNIIRSAFAARLLTAFLAGRDGPAIASAGLEAISGRPAEPHAISAAFARGIDLRTHAATRVSDAHVDRADVIFVMDAFHLAEMRRRFSRAVPKTFLLSAVLEDAPLEITDPILGDANRFEACFDDITRAVRAIAGALAPIRMAS